MRFRCSIYPFNKCLKLNISSVGGIGEAVSSAVAEERDIIVKRLAVRGVPRSGKPAELLSMFGIDAEHIAKAVKEVLKK